jgi:hypothetical protein
MQVYVCPMYVYPYELYMIVLKISQMGVRKVWAARG